MRQADKCRPRDVARASDSNPYRGCLFIDTSPRSSDRLYNPAISPKQARIGTLFAAVPGGLLGHSHQRRTPIRASVRVVR
jgi:hypothetical protein